ncbi:tetratricopeptide repeat protein [Krasilnikovia cinnamomea]|uniref:Tetratricopeptide repeat protein n=1 Tax=Krasilnikovia cinnamomea TaxID=349313 RepID=A0A4V2G7B3_9ACTN|nr:tetratricopeptide repeat protein [Krasilnikovia cinnamomea]RZU51856.1 tetratricopeptide repeat protein [Krasilnikovia cinnamomea]
MEHSSVADLVCAALRTAASETARRQPRVLGAVRALRETLARSLAGDAGAGIAVDQLSALDTDPATVRTCRDRLHAALRQLAPSDLQDLAARAHSVLMLTDPDSTQHDRLPTGSRDQSHRAETRRVAVGASRAGSSTADPVRFLAPVSAAEREAAPKALPTDVLRAKAEALAVAEQTLGSTHRDTLAARIELALAYAAEGLADQAAVLLRRVLADREQLLGVDHPDTALARSYLAVAHRSAGNAGARIDLLKRSLADAESELGEDHPDTRNARVDLAYTFRAAGENQAAIDLMARVLADAERLLGPDHRDTRTAAAALRWWRDGDAG